jgi:hypothetical protein
MVETPYQNQTVCQMCDLQAEARMHADDGLPSPHAPKMSPARFDTSYIGQLASRIVELRAGAPRTMCTTPHIGFNVRARFGLQQAQPPKLQIFHLSDVPI